MTYFQTCIRIVSTRFSNGRVQTTDAHKETFASLFDATASLPKALDQLRELGFDIAAVTIMPIDLFADVLDDE